MVLQAETCNKCNNWVIVAKCSSTSKTFDFWTKLWWSCLIILPWFLDVVIVEVNAAFMGDNTHWKVNLVWIILEYLIRTLLNKGAGNISKVISDYSEKNRNWKFQLKLRTFFVVLIFGHICVRIPWVMVFVPHK